MFWFRRAGAMALLAASAMVNSAAGSCLTILEEATVDVSTISDPASAQHRAMNEVCLTGDGVSEAELLQRYALATFAYSVTNRDALFAEIFINGDWNPCDSNLITCNPSKQVTRLVVSGLYLRGTLPEELGLLPHLRELFLDQNYFSGSLPSSWGTSMTSLHALVVNENVILKGSVPDTYVGLTKLRNFDIEDTDLTGELPDGFCDLDLYEFRANCDMIHCCTQYLTRKMICAQAVRRAVRGTGCVTPLSPEDSTVCRSEVATARTVVDVPVDIRGVGKQEQEMAVTAQVETPNGETCLEGVLSIPEYLGPMNICLVIDISASTYDFKFAGTPVGDVNGDGRSDTVLDAEIISLIRFLESVVETPGLGNDMVDVGLVTFSTVGEFVGRYVPADPNDPTKVNPELENALLSLRFDDITNFDDALDKAIDYFEVAPVNRTNMMFFLSDGVPNVCGDNDDELSLYNCQAGEYLPYNSNFEFNGRAGAHNYTWELERLDDFEVIRHAIGVGGESDVDPGSGLDMIDNSPDLETGEMAIQVTDSDALRDLLTANPVKGNVQEFELLLNDIPYQGIVKESLVSGPIGFYFGPFTLSGLDDTPGTENTLVTNCLMEINGNEYSLTTTNIVTGAGY